MRISDLATFWPLHDGTDYSDTEIYTNTIQYSGPIEIPVPLEGFFLCGVRITLVRSKTKQIGGLVKYLNRRIDEEVPWLNQYTELDIWTPTVYPIPRSVIQGTKLSIELDVAPGTLILVKFLYLELYDLTTTHGWAFVNDQGTLQQYSMFTHESYWLSISQFHKLGAQHFPRAPVPAIPTMRRLLAGGTWRPLEKPDDMV
jgi:hypothetical protein